MFTHSQHCNVSLYPAPAALCLHVAVQTHVRAQTVVGMYTERVGATIIHHERNPDVEPDGHVRSSLADDLVAQVLATLKSRVAVASLGVPFGGCLGRKAISWLNIVRATWCRFGTSSKTAQCPSVVLNVGICSCAGCGPKVDATKHDWLLICLFGRTVTFCQLLWRLWTIVAVTRYSRIDLLCCNHFRILVTDYTLVKMMRTAAQRGILRIVATIWALEKVFVIVQVRCRTSVVTNHHR